MATILEVPAGNVWAVATVVDQPEIILQNWTIYQIEPRGTRHFVGHNVEDGEGRVSSAVQRFDPKHGVGVTKSGRVYRLIHGPGYDDDGHYVWRHWLWLQTTPVEKYVDVSDEVWQSMLFVDPDRARQGR